MHRYARCMGHNIRYFQTMGEHCQRGTSASTNLAQNPSITEQCGGFVTGKSYCVEAFNEPTPPPEPTEATTTTAAPPPATTTPSNGVSTPLPIQPDMVANCNAFHFVVKDENCATIAAKHSISTAQFVSWNPSVGADCRGLWLSVNVCVSIIGLAPPSTTPTRTTLQTTPSTTTTTTTRPAGGISTPSPAQPGMISNCVQFHFVVKGDTCASLAQKYNINVATFLNYNTQAGNDCRNLWLEAYACVKVAGQPTALPTPVNTAVGCAAYYTQIGGSILSFVNTCPKTR